MLDKIYIIFYMCWISFLKENEEYFEVFKNILFFKNENLKIE